MAVRRNIIMIDNMKLEGVRPSLLSFLDGDGVSTDVRNVYPGMSIVEMDGVEWDGESKTLTLSSDDTDMEIHSVREVDGRIKGTLVYK